ncbi:MAG: SDR family oxidoreductase [Thermoanaerobaculia bacterium]|nr:SDR family oxidoreductase [Thermoanaerobaculia bacterium]
MPATLLTGFPGFLGSELVPRILAGDPERRVVCLVQSRFAELAAERAREVAERDPSAAGRISLVEGDITEPGLGMGSGRDLTAEVDQVYHLAAVYDLMVRRRLALRVNVTGTSHVLDFCESCPAFERLHYVSTCYVSGRYAGIYTESDLDKGQTFNNHYEETKFLAEVEVQQRMRGGLPATVYRPAIVVGDSTTGATQKYDGPYFVIRWVLRQPLVAAVPVVGDPTAVRVNLVPRDFVIDAISHLGGLPESRGRVYQLADPEPLTVDEILDAVAEATGRRIVRVPLLKGAAKFALDWVPGVERLLQIPSASVDYFVHPTHYTSENTQAALAGTGIRVPPLTSYLDRLVRFARLHPEIGAEAMV